MYLYMYEELALAIAREREEEARQASGRAKKRRALKLPYRPRPIRELVKPGVDEEPKTDEIALEAAPRNRCHCGVT
jgi:hypothetical protein